MNRSSFWLEFLWPLCCSFAFCAVLWSLPSVLFFGRHFLCTMSVQIDLENFLTCMPPTVRGDFGARVLVWRGGGRKRAGHDPAVLVSIEAPYVHYGATEDFTNGWVEIWSCASGRTIRFTRPSPSPDGWVLQHLGIRDVPWDVADAPWGVPPWPNAPDTLREVVEIWRRPQEATETTVSWSGRLFLPPSEEWEWLL